MKPVETWKERALYALMSDISEDCWCAGWMMGTEYVLWDMAANPAGSLDWGQSTVDPRQLADLREMSQEIGGWIVWWDDAHDALLPPDEWGPRVVTFDEWDAIRKRKEA
jgi:hypothetical protein